MVAREQIPDVVFAGFLDQTQIAKAYAVADVFTLFSGYDETWGLVVNEAMNFGLPVVVSDRVGSAADLVRQGENGLVVAHQDVPGLARGLERLIDSESMRRRFGDVSRDIVSTYTYDRTADGLVSAVAAAVGSRRWELAQDSGDSAPEGVT
jgi:glycosyltransferase involved in cell wall biosynthesis